MSNAWKDHRLPLVISIAALIIATFIGLVPVMQNRERAAPQASTDFSSIEDRIAALETTEPATVANIPPNADNARLRQEIDLITRGLGNQTGRISRLKSVVDGIVDPNGQVIAPTRVMDEIALAKRGLSNLTRRINAIEDRLDALDSAAADIARLQQQMAIVDTAMGRLARNSNLAKDERADLNAVLSQQTNMMNALAAAQTAARAEPVPAAAIEEAAPEPAQEEPPQTDTTAEPNRDLAEIEQMLEAILEQLRQ